MYWLHVLPTLSLAVKWIRGQLHWNSFTEYFYGVVLQSSLTDQFYVLLVV
jgi:hypothetical protein